MDEETIRTQLREAQASLERNTEEREAILAMVKACEGWLRTFAKRTLPLPFASEPAPQPSQPRPRASNEPRGEISMRSAVLKVIREAHGEPLHVREILHRARALGAETAGKNPEAIVDLIALTFRRIANGSKRRRLSSTGGAFEGHDLIATRENLLDSRVLALIQVVVLARDRLS